MLPSQSILTKKQNKQTNKQTKNKKTKKHDFTQLIFLVLQLEFSDASLIGVN